MGNEKSDGFIFGEVCSYQIVWPNEAKEGDEINVRLTDIEVGTSVFVAAGEGFALGEKLEEEQLAQVNDSLKIAYPS